MKIERTFVGLDVHARSVVACALDDVTGELSKARLVPDHETIMTWLRGLNWSGAGQAVSISVRYRSRRSASS